MKKELLVSLVTGAFVVGLAGGVSAAVVSYSDQSLWETAVGTTSLFDFESSTTGSFTYMDFGDFDATLQNGFSSYYNPSITGYAGSNVIRLQGYSANANLVFNFDDAITSVGFNWWNTDPTGDKIEFLLGGTSYLLSGSSGFFGVISDDSFSSWAVSDSAGGGGVLSYGYMDNIRYNSTNPVPEPATMLLFGTGLVSLIGISRRKNKK